MPRATPRPGAGRGRLALLDADADAFAERLRALADTVDALRAGHEGLEIEAGSRAEMYVPRVFRPL